MGLSVWWRWCWSRECQGVLYTPESAVCGIPQVRVYIYLVESTWNFTRPYIRDNIYRWSIKFSLKRIWLYTHTELGQCLYIVDASHCCVCALLSKFPIYINSECRSGHSIYIYTYEVWCSIKQNVRNSGLASTREHIPRLSIQQRLGILWNYISANILHTIFSHNTTILGGCGYSQNSICSSIETNTSTWVLSDLRSDKEHAMRKGTRLALACYNVAKVSSICLLKNAHT